MFFVHKKFGISIYFVILYNNIPRSDDRLTRLTRVTKKGTRLSTLKRKGAFQNAPNLTQKFRKNKKTKNIKNNGNLYILKYLFTSVHFAYSNIERHSPSTKAFTSQPLLESP